MGARAGAYEMPPVYDEEERYDEQFTIRAPHSLSGRAELLKKSEGLRSINEARVRALRLGLSVYEFVATHAEEFRAVRAPGRLTVEEAVVLLLEEALLSRSKKPKK
jgi:hypothetical protein